MKGNNSIFLRRSFFPRYALGMPSFNNSVAYFFHSSGLYPAPYIELYMHMHMC
mgnify:CR=1 FL=1